MGNKVEKRVLKVNLLVIVTTRSGKVDQTCFIIRSLDKGMKGVYSEDNLPQGTCSYIVRELFEGIKYAWLIDYLYKNITKRNKEETNPPKRE